MTNLEENNTQKYNKDLTFLLLFFLFKQSFGGDVLFFMEKKYACICKSCALKCCQDFLINADTGISNLRHVMERIGQLDFDVVIVEHFFSAPEWKHLYLSSDTTVIVFDNKRTSLDVLFGIEASVLDKMLARGQLKSISSNTMNIDKFSISEVNSNNHYATPLNIFGRRCLLKA